jgi:Flp pilus assembly pilin Flp
MGTTVSIWQLICLENGVRYPIALPGSSGNQPNKTLKEILKMNTLILRLRQLNDDEAGQGLIEYVMLGALVIAAAAACFPGLASALNSAFSAIGSKLQTYIS